MKRVIFIGTLIFSTSLLSGCSIWSDWFASDDIDEPARLVKFTEEVSLDRQWSINIGKGQGKKYNRLKPAIAGEAIYAASSNGRVLAIDLDTGRSIWETRLDLDITGGVGVGGDLVLVGTENALVLALDKDSGEVLWQVEVSSEVLSIPVTDGEIVVAQSVDGKLTGLDADTGEQLWVYESTMPELSLRGVSSPLIQGNFVIAAFANGSVVSVALDNGTLRWDERVAIPTGRSEIERIVDIDGELYIDDNGLLLVASYQGYFAALDVVTGLTRWRIEESASVGAGSGFGNIYLSDDNGHVNAYRTSQEDAVWVNDHLELRQISAPLGFSSYVAVGDYEGYVHLLSQVDGRFVGRVKVDGKGVRVGMLARGNTLYVYGNGGSLVAMSVK